MSILPGGSGRCWQGVKQGAISGAVFGGLIGAVAGGISTPKGHNIWTGNSYRTPVSTVNELNPGKIQTLDEAINSKNPLLKPSNNSSSQTGLLEPKYAANSFDKGGFVATREPFTPDDLINAIGKENFNLTGKGYLNGKLVMSENTFSNLKSDWGGYVTSQSAKSIGYNFPNGYSAGFYVSKSTQDLSLQINTTIQNYKIRIILFNQ